MCVIDDTLFPYDMESKMGQCQHKGKQGKALAGRSNLCDSGDRQLFQHEQKRKEKKKKQALTPMYIQTNLPCVSVDWVNQPNFPFFFSVRSASVTPWCYQHAVHVARQQRQQRVSIQQRGKERERKVWQEKAAIHTTDSYHGERLQNIPLTNSDRGLCCSSTVNTNPVF